MHRASDRHGGFVFHVSFSGMRDDVLPQRPFANPHFPVQQLALEEKDGVHARMDAVSGLPTTVPIVIGLPVHVLPLNPLEVSLMISFHHLFLSP